MAKLGASGRIAARAPRNHDFIEDGKLVSEAIPINGFRVSFGTQIGRPEVDDKFDLFLAVWTANPAGRLDYVVAGGPHEAVAFLQDAR